MPEKNNAEHHLVVVIQDDIGDHAMPNECVIEGEYRMFHCGRADEMPA